MYVFVLISREQLVFYANKIELKSLFPLKSLRHIAIEKNNKEE